MKRSLTDRQRRIAQLVAIGCTDREIATTLSISQGTVKGHLEAIMRVLDLPRGRGRRRMLITLHIARSLPP